MNAEGEKEAIFKMCLRPTENENKSQNSDQEKMQHQAAVRGDEAGVGTDP